MTQGFRLDKGAPRRAERGKQALKLPRDHVVYGGLQTSFVQFEGLLAELERQGVDGFVEMRTDKYTGTLHLVEGAVRSARVEVDGEAVSGDDAADAIIARARRAGAAIDVFAAPRAVMLLATAGDELSLKYQGLTSDLLPLDEVIANLEAERLTGYLEAVLWTGTSTARVFFLRGKVVEAMLADPSHTSWGVAMLPVITDAVRSAGAEMDVYELPMDEEAGEDAGESSSATGGEAAATTAPVEEPRPDPQSLAAAWNATLATVERVVDESAHPGSFRSALTEVLEERSADEPSLRPDGHAFAYRHGRVEFLLDPPVGFSEMLGDCLSDAVSRISFRLRKADLESTIRDELAPVMEEHGSLLGRDGFDRTAGAFVAA